MTDIDTTDCFESCDGDACDCDCGCGGTEDDCGDDCCNFPALLCCLSAEPPPRQEVPVVSGAMMTSTVDMPDGKYRNAITGQGLESVAALHAIPIKSSTMNGHSTFKCCEMANNKIITSQPH